MSAPARVVVLISGRGSNLRALVETARTPGAPFEISGVLSDQPAAAGLQWAAEAGIATRAVIAARGQPRATYDEGLAAAIDAQRPALVVLAGFMRILSASFVERYAGRLLNIHPSLLPKYAGLHTHRRVLEAGDREHGATVHFVTEELDGGPRVLQGRIAVDASDTEETLAARLITMEHRIYSLAVLWFAQGRLVCRGPLAYLDGEALTEPVQVA